MRAREPPRQPGRVRGGAGRGRSERQWKAGQPGTGLALPAAPQPLLTLAPGPAAAAALRC